MLVRLPFLTDLPRYGEGGPTAVLKSTKAGSLGASFLEATRESLSPTPMTLDLERLGLSCPVLA